MARISGRIRIAAPVERVFDTAADSRNEPSFNPAMTGVELLTPLPIGLGTRFRARMGKAGGEMLVELTEFERPHRLSSRTASSMMETTGRLTFAAEGDGTVMSWDWQVRPRGWMRMLGPLVGALGGRMERRIWTGLKHQLEDPGSARSPDRGPPSPRPRTPTHTGRQRPQKPETHHTRHDSEPFSSCDLAGLKDVDGLGELPGFPGAAAEFAQDAPGLELGVGAFTRAA